MTAPGDDAELGASGRYGGQVARWTLSGCQGELLLHTGVAGRAARMGHRLIIAMREWQATVTWQGGKPVSAALAVDVESFDVLRGEGGVKALSKPEKALVRSNALRSLNVGRYPQICFTAETIDETDYGYRLAGSLQIHGRTESR